MTSPSEPSRRGLPSVPGLAARDLAMRAVDGVLSRGMALEDAFETTPLEGRDLALARMIAGTATRRLGTIGFVLDKLLDRGLPRKSGPLEGILVTAAAQILFMDVPDHSAVDLAVRLTRTDQNSAGFAGLTNAVLRKLSGEKAERLAAVPAEADTPAWLFTRWRNAYGPAVAEAIAAAHKVEPALDLTVKTDPHGWATRLGGRVLPTGSVRITTQGSVTALEGFAEGQWWVQDAAAALPARLLGAVAGQRILDLCAAPGGKTAQLAAAGARVTAVDRSDQRLARLRENMTRLGLAVDVVATDALTYRADPFDGVLLDAPCSATGTIRRHPDVAWAKTQSDLATLVVLQSKMLDRAATLVKTGGKLVYCTCSLEPDEGERQIAAFLKRNAQFARDAVRPGELGGLDAAITSDGDLRTLPSLWPDADTQMGGMDGFFAARLKRQAA